MAVIWVHGGFLWRALLADSIVKTTRGQLISALFYLLPNVALGSYVFYFITCKAMPDLYGKLKNPKASPGDGKDGGKP